MMSETTMKGNTTMKKTADILIGNTAKRTVAGGGYWMGQGQVKASYEDAIPVGDVYSQLLDWTPQEVPNANLIPVDLGDADLILGGMPYRVAVREDHKAIVRSDTKASLGVFKHGYDSSAYNRMVQFTQDALQGHLPIWNAGLLRGGAQFFLTVGMDETMHDDKSGLDFLPYVMFHSSLDGSLANTWVPGSQIAQCDNQFAGMRKNAKDRIVRFKRSRFSLSDERIRDLRGALAVIELEAQATTDFIHTAVEVPLSRSQWIKVLDIKVPLPPAENKAGYTRAQHLRQEIDALYQLSPMVEPWTGTAFGAVQAFNTYNNRNKPARGALKIERVFEQVLRGTLAEQDTNTVSALNRVLDRPLVFA
jgi:phage/plasmid-like protein (TIGR03299 family)